MVEGRFSRGTPPPIFCIFSSTSKHKLASYLQARLLICEQGACSMQAIARIVASIELTIRKHLLGHLRVVKLAESQACGLVHKEEP